MTTNLFDYFEELATSEGALSPWAARTPRRPRADHDLKLVPRAGAWQRDAESLDALARIEAEPWVRSVERGENDVRLRLESSWIERTGADLEAGGSAEGALTDLVQGERFSVQFWDANATKALHVGHLRNLALGNALAAALAQAGGRVERRSVISDAGRSMGEAMAGIVKSGRHVQSWPDGDQKSDHFVGVCYADYVADGVIASDEVQEDSLTRELELHDDAADGLLKDVLRGDPDALELWFKTRAWVIAGQRKTLARLGVSFDRVFFESDFLADANALVAEGLRSGTLVRREDGVVVYETGVEDLEQMPLVRADGLSTQHLRAVAYWMSAPDQEGVRTMQVCGAEWVSHAACIQRLMSELKASAASNGGVHPTHDIFHGMVSRQKRAVASSADGALLIDDLIEWLERQLAADERRREVRRAHPAPERIPAQVVLGYFLPHPITPPVDFEPERLLAEGESMGWDLVCARARAGSAQAGGGRTPARDPEYRFAVVQSELYRRHLRQAVQRYDVRPMAKFLEHLARWYLEDERSTHTERVVHTVLDRGARGLGLETGR